MLMAVEQILMSEERATVLRNIMYSTRNINHSREIRGNKIPKGYPQPPNPSKIMPQEKRFDTFRKRELEA